MNAHVPEKIHSVTSTPIMQPVKIRRCSLSRGPQKPRSPVGTRPTRHSATTVSAGSSAPNSADRRHATSPQKALPSWRRRRRRPTPGAPPPPARAVRCAVGDEARSGAQKGDGASAATLEATSRTFNLRGEVDFTPELHFLEIYEG